MPIEFILILGACVALMAVSAWYLGDENKSVRASARVGLVLGGTGLFMSTLYYAVLFAVVLIIVLPIALIVAWFNGAF